MGNPSKKIELLQVGRALAALAVVLDHSGLASKAFTSAMNPPSFDWGAYGVDFFFVLSGFIIFHVHQNDAKGLGPAFSFAGKRIRRVFIPYLPISIAMIAAYAIFPNLSATDREYSLVKSLFLVPATNPPALSVAWTLVYEMVFYTFFLTFFFSRKFLVLAGLWGGGIVIASATGAFTDIGSPLLKTTFDPIVLEFLAGVLVAAVWPHLRASTWKYYIIAGVLGVPAFVFIKLAMPNLGREFLGFSFALIVLGMVLFENSNNINIPSWLLSLGAGSYAVYLVHNPTISIAARLFGKTGSWGFTLVASAIVGTLVGMLYHYWFEKPALRLISRNFRRAPEILRK